MNPIKKILCPIDCSPGSKVALDYALTVSKHFGGELHVLHAWHLPYLARRDLSVMMQTQGQQPVWKVVEESAKEETTAFLSVLAPEERHKIHIHIREGQPAEAIMELVKSGAFDLVVMGTHGRAGLAHLAIGSTAERVVRQCPCPVLTVRHQG